MSVNISSLTSAPETFIHVAALVVRPDAVTGGERILQSDPTTLHFKPGRKDFVYTTYLSVVVDFRKICFVTMTENILKTAAC